MTWMRTSDGKESKDMIPCNQNFTPFCAFLAIYTNVTARYPRLPVFAEAPGELRSPSPSPSPLQQPSLFFFFLPLSRQEHAQRCAHLASW